ncbi:hypothetical protein PVA38_12425 [Streptococcus pneumoniae D39]|nr:hypothetical protein PVA38_12425 [Streptococcus pneumoniae D39]
MCIRDSNQAVKDKEIFFTEEKPWEIRFDNSYPSVFFDDLAGVYRCYYSTFTDDEESEKYSLEAVSYTHLRAHETVLDLVCRLLLEKKKYNTIINISLDAIYSPLPTVFKQ